VAGIVGAGGNAGAVAAGFLLKSTGITSPRGLLTLGILVAASALLAPLIRFSEADESAVRSEITGAARSAAAWAAAEPV
jgi:NNP family nitrate/nitrite transporter-like MFS transporter